jgi:hypothetical protein
LKNSGLVPAAPEQAQNHGWSRYFIAQPVAHVPQVDSVRHTAEFIYELSPCSMETLWQQAVSTVADSASPLGVFRSVARAPLERTAFAKDQMVTVFVPLGQRKVESVVPYASVVFDAFGGSWIYIDRTEKAAERHQFERRRVELGPAIGDGVVIRPTAGQRERVVTTGAGVLFSREFHKTPVRP